MPSAMPKPRNSVETYADARCWRWARRTLDVIVTERLKLWKEQVRASAHGETTDGGVPAADDSDPST